MSQEDKLRRDENKVLIQLEYLVLYEVKIRTEITFLNRQNN